MGRDAEDREGGEAGLNDDPVSDQRDVTSELRFERGSRAVSISLSTMCGGVGMSGLPMPKSIMSSPRARACALRRFTSSKI